MEKYYGVSPFVYCLDNSICFIDPNGQMIIVQDNEGGKLYEYEWKEQNGNWGFYGASGEVYSGSNGYILALANALKTLMEGQIGESMVKEIADNKDYRIIIGESWRRDKGERSNFYNKGTKQLAWSSTVSQIGATFLSLGHEMAHAMDDLRGTMNNAIWIPSSPLLGLKEDIPYSEIFAMHIENQIRKEHGYSLRESYLEGNSKVYKTWSRVVNSEGYSLYFNNSKNTDYKLVLPSQRLKILVWVLFFIYSALLNYMVILIIFITRLGQF